MKRGVSWVSACVPMTLPMYEPPESPLLFPPSFESPWLAAGVDAVDMGAAAVGYAGRGLAGGLRSRVAQSTARNPAAAEKRCTTAVHGARERELDDDVCDDEPCDERTAGCTPGCQANRAQGLCGKEFHAKTVRSKQSSCTSAPKPPRLLCLCGCDGGSASRKDKIHEICTGVAGNSERSVISLDFFQNGVHI